MNFTNLFVEHFDIDIADVLYILLSEIVDGCEAVLTVMGH